MGEMLSAVNDKYFHFFDNLIVSQNYPVYLSNKNNLNLE
jgi:hypothetical protein